MRRWLLAAAVLASGCVVSTEPTLALGPRAAPGYQIAAGASLPVDALQYGFGVTANGSGGYRLFFSDARNVATPFSGIISTDGSFDPRQTRPLTGQEQVTMNASSVSVAGVPGASVMGVDVVSSTEPVYVDVTVNGSRVGMQILFIGGQTQAVIDSAYNPVAFTSP